MERSEKLSMVSIACTIAFVLVTFCPALPLFPPCIKITQRVRPNKIMTVRQHPEREQFTCVGAREMGVLTLPRQRRAPYITNMTTQGPKRADVSPSRN